MARRRYAFDEQRVQKFVSEGRGQNTGSAYRPWLEIRDLPSRGRSHRIYGIKTRRVHHLLSDGEFKCFLKFEADKNVIDIREQFPLDRLQTYKVAREQRCKHPVTLDGTPYVMTVDFVVTTSTGGAMKHVPFTFKYDFDTVTPRERQLLDIAAEFWRRQGCELQFIDRTFFDETLVINYDAVRSRFDIASMQFKGAIDVAAVAHAIREQVTPSSRLLGDVCRQIAAQHGADSGDVFSIALHLIARNVVHADLSAWPDLASMPMRSLSITLDNDR